MYSAEEIATITGGHLYGDPGLRVNSFLHDSRHIHPGDGAMFVAIRSGRDDGHRYITQVAAAGVHLFLVEEGYQFDEQVKATYVVCASTLLALQRLAAHHRSRFRIPVIGITGSNGKTVVKEWLYQLLKQDYVICRSPKSYNSQLGVPLSVLNLNQNHTLAIFEAGISQPGEMEKLGKIIRPDIGVFTHLGAAHDQGFTGREQKLQEKLLLFKDCPAIIINGADKKEVPAAIKKRAEFVQDHYSILADEKGFYLRDNSNDQRLELPFADEASVNNAATCAFVLQHLKFSDDRIREGLKNLQPVALRLEIRNGINNSLIINDYYNSDLDSVRIALQFLQQQNRRRSKVVVLSDIEQSGMPAAELYGMVARLCRQAGVSQVIAIGHEISAHRELFPAGSLFFSGTAEFLGELKNNASLVAGSTVLLKGARSFGFEVIGRLLQQKSHDTVFEVDLEKLRDNVNYYRGLLKGGTRLMCMVKAMGYGSGGAEIARTLQHMGVNYLAVAYADEGVELRQSQVDLPVMVMNPEEEGFDDIINYQLEPEIYSLRLLEHFAARLNAHGLTEPYPVHIKIDTGMKRLGFAAGDLEELCRTLKGYSQLRVRSIFSHLAGSDAPELDEFTKQQISQFENACRMIEEAVGYRALKHICNSGGITRFPEAHYDMVRLGIGMYGIGVNGQEQGALKNVGTLKTRISQVKRVNAGETVGYSRKGQLLKAGRIATIPIGYADGFSRQLGNGRHQVYLKGAVCKTVGNICMDMCMIDVSHVDCEEGDEVVIFDSIEHIQALAKALDTIPYEVLTSVSARVKRVYVQE